jgi:hypothetical protein
VEKTIYMSQVLSRPQLKYLGMTVTNQNLIREKIKRRLNSCYAWYNTVQNLLSFHLLFRSVKIDVHKTVILPLVLYGCDTWSLILREENRLVVLRGSY